MDTGDSNYQMPSEKALQGYEYEFVPSLDPKYECSICLMCQRDPTQTRCGHRFCYNCILRWIQERRGKCPIDNSEVNIDQIFRDNFAKREILSLIVKCPHSRNGCGETLKLTTVDAHLAICDFSAVECPNDCNCDVVILRRDLPEHLEKECPKRLINCILCTATFAVDQQQAHFSRCPCVSVDCAHCGDSFQRRDEQSHLANDCARVDVQCPYADIGCDIKTNRVNMDAHIDQNTQHHLYLLTRVYIALRPTMQHTASYEHRELPRCQRSSSVVNDMQMELGKLMVADDGDGRSRRHSSTNGIVNADKLIQELFHRCVNLEQRNREQEIRCESALNRVAALEAEVSHLRSLPPPAAAQPSTNGVFVWKLLEFKKFCEPLANGKYAILHSDHFYSHPYGYRMCLRANVTENKANVKFFSIFLHIQRGDHDDILDWPFAGKMALSLLEQCRENRNAESAKGPIMEVMATKPGLEAFNKPTTPRNSKGFGYTEFADIETLLTGGYVKNDCVVVKAVVQVPP